MSSEQVTTMSVAKKTATLALAGQPNVGKSTVFNILTGLHQHVGNWPGKTVEQRVGRLEHDDVIFHVVDLPGTYCLTAASPEERITRDFIIHQKPDVVVVIINAAALERNLYLVAELLTLKAPLIIGLNMVDVAEQEGFDVDPKVLSANLGVPVVPMVASRAVGVCELVDEAVAIIEEAPRGEPNCPHVRQDHQQVVDELRALVQEYVPSSYPRDWVALKLFEGDEEITAMMRDVLPSERWERVSGILRQHEDAVIAVASGRYEWIGRVTRTAFKRPRVGRITFTQRIDHLATHPFWGLVVLALVLAFIFEVTYALGGPLQEWMATHVVEAFAAWVSGRLVSGPAWLSGLIVDGVLGGVGTVLTFIPILAVFFASMGLLEDIGYMARAAYIMDRFMHAIGLHGKSFMPLFLGFGCNVPAIMGARIIESRRSRLLTIMLAPLVPCAARLGVLAVLVPIFFPRNATLVIWALTGLPLVVLAVAGALVNRLVLRGEEAAFIMEMPLYHIPYPKSIALLVWRRILAFLRKAGTVILVVSVIVWALATFPNGDIDTSYMAAIGRFLSPIGSFMGLGWKPLVAILTSFVAKENVVATLGVLYGVGENSAALAQVLSTSLSSPSALALLVAEMLFVPCVVTLAVIKQETGSWKWVLVNVGFLTGLTVVASAITYHVAALAL
ncbi:MAG: ferrous iron transport protein B [Chloroflexota bacterium]|nr:ferrous iron transport protein B [Chloroflexota bacterium]